MPSPDAAVYSTLTASGFKGTKAAWPLGSAPPLPWFTYKHVRSGEFYADNSNYAKMQRYYIDFYQKETDAEQLELFEEALSTLGPYSCLDTWTQSESCWITSYRLTYHPDI